MSTCFFFFNLFSKLFPSTNRCGGEQTAAWCLPACWVKPHQPPWTCKWPRNSLCFTIPAFLPTMQTWHFWSDIIWFPQPPCTAWFHSSKRGSEQQTSNHSFFISALMGDTSLAEGGHGAGILLELGPPSCQVSQSLWTMCTIPLTF